MSYLRSIHLQKDKSVFKISELPVEKFSEALGLPGMPKIKFLSKELAKQKKNASRAIAELTTAAEKSKTEADAEESEEDSSSEESDEDGDGESAPAKASAEKVRPGSVLWLSLIHLSTPAEPGQNQI